MTGRKFPVPRWVQGKRGLVAVITICEGPFDSLGSLRTGKIATALTLLVLDEPRGLRPLAMTVGGAVTILDFITAPTLQTK